MRPPGGPAAGSHSYCHGPGSITGQGTPATEELSLSAGPKPRLKGKVVSGRSSGIKLVPNRNMRTKWLAVVTPNREQLKEQQEED